MRTAFTAWGVALLVSSGCLVQGDWNCSSRRSIDAPALPLAGVSSVRVIAGSGRLEVVGLAGLSEIRAGGEACAANDARLAEVELRAEVRGGEAVIETILPNRTSLDLRVELPSTLPIVIDDGSGSMEVRDVGDVRIDDGSGSMTVENVGALEIDDGSGSIRVREVAGDLRIRDGSGSMSIEGVRGDVRIDDRSGSVKVERVDGSVIVEDDGSGSIRVEDVGGDFIVEDDGSGGVDYARVGGRVEIRD